MRNCIGASFAVMRSGRSRFVDERGTLPQLKSLKAMVAGLNQLLASGSRDAWIERHRAFHDAIFDLSENKILKREALRLMRLTDRYRSLAADITRQGTHLDAQIEEQLLKALSAKDRKLLLGTYDKGRAIVLEGLMAVLAARGV
ncbi:DNA-binding GntR family transcriptional regulator [Paraburkholderia sp. WSM4175]|uniref:FCD domain-containing protein n=1 Tax=Paraburkholderia sp. WSM4175 TaxID=2991072 RepID=UPI003D1F23C9